jgi:hypothetical protein
MIARGRSLERRRQDSLLRIRQQRIEANRQYKLFLVRGRAWAGSPKSLLQAFLAGIVFDHGLALLRYRILATGFFRPISGLARTLMKASRFL